MYIEWSNRDPQIALLIIDQRGSKTYHVQWLDSRNAPHDTGRTLGQAALAHAQISLAITWRTAQKTNDDDDNDNHHPTQHTYIAGPVTTTFPNPEGWTTAQPSKTII